MNRGHSGAVLETITERCEQAESIVCNWTVKTESERFIDIQAETLCLHGDSSDALRSIVGCLGIIATKVFASPKTSL